MYRLLTIALDLRSIVLMLLLLSGLAGQDVEGKKERRDPTVGAAGWISQIILPGTELEGVPIDPNSPMVVRVIDSFPHGDSFRYDIQFHGLEPGKYDLSKWLRRKDGTSLGDLPEIDVEIRSLLPPGQIEPNPLDQGILPRLGGYRAVAILISILWFAILLGLIFAGRKKAEIAAVASKPVSLADLLKPRLTAASRNELNPGQYAELERMLFAYWRKKLSLTEGGADEAMEAIKRNETAGPLMLQLESWMHNPQARRDVDLAELLRPYETIPVEEVEVDE